MKEINQYLAEKAKKLGAVTYRIMQTFTKRNTVPFSFHFFNEKGLEIAYYIEDFKHSSGLTILPYPREWSKDFDESPSYTKHYDIK